MNGFVVFGDTQLKGKRQARAALKVRVSGKQVTGAVVSHLNSQIEERCDLANPAY